MLTVRSQVAVYASVFLSCTSFSIVMPTLWPYLRSLGATPSFLALVVATYSIGEGTGAILFASIFRGSTTRGTQMRVMMTGVLGSILYVGAAGIAKSNQGVGTVCVIMGRLLHGGWTGGAQAVQQAYLADVLPTAELTPAVVAINAAASLGFVFGPVFGFAAGLVPPFAIVPRLLVVDELTAAGYAVLLASLACCALYAAVFDERTDRAGIDAHILTDSSRGQGCASAVRDEELPLLHAKTMPRKTRAVLLALIFCNVAFFIHFYGFAIQETATTPLVQMLYSWTVRDANILFTASGVLSLLAFAVLQMASHRIDDRALLLLSLCLGALGYGFLVPMRNGTIGIPQFLFGFALMSLAFPIGRASCVSLYTKLLPSQAQAVGQAILLAVGAVARIVGPFPAAAAVSSVATALYVFATAVLAFISCAAVQLAMYHRLRT